MLVERPSVDALPSAEPEAWVLWVAASALPEAPSMAEGLLLVATASPVVPDDALECLPARPSRWLAQRRERLLARHLEPGRPWTVPRRVLAPPRRRWSCRMTRSHAC